MKNLILLLAITLTFSCCKNDDDNNSNANLPPATQTGANTVGCLVNGNLYLPSQRGLNAPVNCFYLQDDSGEFYFTMVFADLEAYGPDVSIQTGKIELQENTTYILNKNPIDDGDYLGGGGTYRLSSSNKYYTNTIETGELTITRLDLGNSIISGTFWFDAKNTNGDIVQIREGRFDWNFY